MDKKIIENPNKIRSNLVPLHRHLDDFCEGYVIGESEDVN